VQHLPSTMSEAEESSTAKAPFDNPEGDIILQSADGVNFHVFKLILSLVSDVFKSMFTLPQDTKQSDVSSVPIISLAENSTILKSLLLLCYPAFNPTFETFEDAKAVLKAAMKYDTRTAISRAGDIICSQFLETKPLELYNLSCVFGWTQHAQTAATRTLQINLKDPRRFSNAFAGMKNMTALDYHKLLVYHHDCGIAAKAVGESLAWLPSENPDMCMWKCISKQFGIRNPDTCNAGVRKIRIANHADVLITPWFDEYLVSSGKELFARPCESTIWLSRVPYNRAINKAITCSFCRSTVVESMERFRVLYAAQVQKVLENVCPPDLSSNSKFA